jgi:hypothetical protein
MTAPARALCVVPGEGERLLFKGTERRMKATSKDTQGHLTAFESSYPAGVPHPLHIHHDAMEGFWEEVHAATEPGTLAQAKLELLSRTYHLQSIGPLPEEGP